MSGNDRESFEIHRREEQIYLSPPDYHLTEEEVRLGSSAIGKISADKTLTPEVISHILALLKEQERFAGGLRRRYSRRTLLRLTAVGIGGTLFGSGITSTINYLSQFQTKEKFTPQSNEQISELQRRINKIIEWEKTHQLNLSDPSGKDPVSKTGWSIGYASRNDRVYYQPRRFEQPIEDGEEIHFPRFSILEDFLAESTGIQAESYIRISDGKKVIKLRILVDGGADVELLLRDTPTEEIDNRVIQFRKVNSNRVEYVSITPHPIDPNLFQVVLMDREVR